MPVQAAFFQLDLQCCLEGSFYLLLMYLFPRAAITKHNKLGGLNNRNLFFHDLETAVQDQGGGRTVLLPSRLFQLLAAQAFVGL